MNWDNYSGKTSCEFVPRLNIHLIYDSAFPLLDIYPREVKQCVL